MPFRLRAFIAHFAISIVLLAALLAVLYLGWYRWPGWYLTGAEVVAGLMILVDVGLGPLGTLVVSSPNKPKREWRRDVALIVGVQLAALSYGSYTLWQGRPLFYAFSTARIEMVRAGDFNDEQVRIAQEQHAAFLPVWSEPVRWVWARLPDDPDERARIMFSAVVGGDDVIAMPRYFRAWEDARDDITKVLLPMDRLLRLVNFDERDYRRRLAELSHPAEELAALPVKGSRRNGVWIIHRSSAEPLAFWPVSVWEAPSKNQK